MTSKEESICSKNPKPPTQNLRQSGRRDRRRHRGGFRFCGATSASTGAAAGTAAGGPAGTVLGTVAGLAAELAVPPVVKGPSSWSFSWWRCGEVLGLTATEVHKIKNFERGYGLLSCNGNNIAVRFQASAMELSLITTDPEELQKLVEGKDRETAKKTGP